MTIFEIRKKGIRTYKIKNDNENFSIFIPSLIVAITIIIFGSILMTTVFPKEMPSPCGIRIPGIVDQSFCQARDRYGIYYYNKKMQVRIP